MMRHGMRALTTFALVLGSPALVACGSDGATGPSVLFTLTLDGKYFSDVTYSADGSKIFVSGDGGITVIDPAAQSVAQTIPACDQATAMTLAPDGTTLTVGCVYGALTEIDTATLEETYRTSGSEDSPQFNGLASLVETQAQWLATQETTAWFVSKYTYDDIPGLAFDVNHEISVPGAAAGAVAVSPNGRTAAVLGVPDALLFLDTSTMNQTGSVELSNDPADVVFSPDGKTAYVTLSRAGVLAVVDVPTMTAGTMVKTGVGNFGVDISPDGSTLYVSNSGDADSISVVDAATQVETGEFEAPAGSGYASVDVAPNGETLVTVNRVGQLVVYALT